MDKKDIETIEKEGYRALSKLGTGTFGSVYLVEKKGKQSVIKIARNKFSKDISIAELRESVYLKQLQSPHIINIGQVHVNIDESYMILEMERMDREMNNSETKQMMKNCIKSIVEGLYYIHSRGYIHNDIKPYNVLIKENQVKLADFGLCNYVGVPIPNKVIKFSGTDYYKAPDSAGDSFYVANNRYNFNSDMYSLGEIMYWSLIKLPEKKKQTVLIDLTSSEYISNRSKFVDYYGEDGVDFMERCLDRNTATRINSKQALVHPYITEGRRSGGFSNYLKDRYPIEDIYSRDYLEDFYRNYKDVVIQFHKIKDTADFIKHIDMMLQFSLKYNETLESFIQYIILFRRAIHDFPEKKIEDLSLCCYSIAGKLYENTSSNVMVKRLQREIPNKTKEDILIKLELEILNYYRFDLPLVPIYSMVYCSSIKNKKVDINISFQSAIRILLSTRIDGKCTLDELVKFVTKPVKGNKMEEYLKDGIKNNIARLDAVEVEPLSEEDIPESPQIISSTKPSHSNMSSQNSTASSHYNVSSQNSNVIIHSTSSRRTIKSPGSNSSQIEVEECTIDGISYFKDENGLVFDSETEELVGIYDFGKKVWINRSNSNTSKSNKPKNSQTISSTSSAQEVDEIVINGINYLIDEKGNVYDIQSEDEVGKYDSKKKKWLEYKDSIQKVYDNAMSLYEQGNHRDMVGYLESHIDMFSDKKYLNLRRLILEKAKGK